MLTYAIIHNPEAVIKGFYDILPVFYAERREPCKSRRNLL